MQKKCALVTGATGGLGYAIAEHLAAEGYDIALNGILDPGAAADVAAKIRASNPVKVEYYHADLADPTAIENMIRRIRNSLGPIAVLINNAVVRHFAPIEEFSKEKWDEALAVNLSAPFHLIRLVLPDMRSQNFGRIINISSGYGFVATRNRVDYVTTKTALLGLTRAVAVETTGTDITCNAICPANLPTEAIRQRIERLAQESGVSTEEAEKRYLAEWQPGGGSFISLESVCKLVSYLCGPNTRELTGTAIPIDAGWLVT